MKIPKIPHPLAIAFLLLLFTLSVLGPAVAHGKMNFTIMITMFLVMFVFCLKVYVWATEEWWLKKPEVDVWARHAKRRRLS